jgi:hypothetical protein
MMKLKVRNGTSRRWKYRLRRDNINISLQADGIDVRGK